MSMSRQHIPEKKTCYVSYELSNICAFGLYLLNIYLLPYYSRKTIKLFCSFCEPHNQDWQLIMSKYVVRLFAWRKMAVWLSCLFVGTVGQAAATNLELQNFSDKIKENQEKIKAVCYPVTSKVAGTLHN
jgi:hypothetical protein